MRVLSVDPGAKHCGFVLQEKVDSYWHLRRFGVFGPIQFLRWMKRQQFDVLVIERPAMGPGADFKTRAVYQDIRKVAENKDSRIYAISPGEWKPFMKARKKDIGDTRLTDPHTRDAERLLMYWRLTCLGE